MPFKGVSVAGVEVSPRISLLGVAHLPSGWITWSRRYDGTPQAMAMWANKKAEQEVFCWVPYSSKPHILFYPVDFVRQSYIDP